MSDTPPRRKKRHLTDEERVLWAKVAKTTTPLTPDRSPPEPDTTSFQELMGEGGANASASPTPAARADTAMRAPISTPAKTAPAQPPLHMLEHRFRKRVIRGVRPIDGRIDLHGLRQDEAHIRLRGFLHDAQLRGHKLVLVITGKGGTGRKTGAWSGIHGEERGVLRRMVPHWLSLPEMRMLVVGYEEAHLTHGGSGALYVRIRRKKEGAGS
ncbi:Smr/MutS family protein [Roseibium aestuarii]|uniref:Smr/MutS family protein n=1 Tax=Roseibium aestuarii TaxID=2600299 RepID=A0ABW4JZ20_9HYPH|nr:Smr/MutS family protein [Roseibium aestuarii]